MPLPLIDLQRKYNVKQYNNLRMFWLSAMYMVLIKSYSLQRLYRLWDWNFVRESEPNPLHSHGLFYLVPYYSDYGHASPFHQVIRIRQYEIV
jgi:hypothetical protein